jgi:hypothetical protein
LPDFHGAMSGRRPGSIQYNYEDEVDKELSRKASLSKHPFQK